MRLRKAILCGMIVVVLASATTLALAARRISAEQSAYTAPSAGRCTPSRLNISAVLPGTRLAVSPLPDSYTASPVTQISLLGVPAAELSAIQVSGSATRSHAGHLLPYSQGDGGSFVASKAFAPGETVTVRGKLTVGAKTQPFAFHFTVAHEDIQLAGAAATVASATPRDPGEWQHFQSAPELRAPVVLATTQSAGTTPGDLFVAPYNGPGPSGPMIFEAGGDLVWFDPLPAGLDATNLQVQQYDGQTVLTWWQGHIPPQGFGQGEEIIDNTSYQQIAAVHAGNGFLADLHDFRLTANNTAVMTVFDPIACNLSSVGGPSGAAVTDASYQEIDLKTGLVRREWSALNHVALSDSYSTATGSSMAWPFDFFHLNSIEPLANGRSLISARNTSALYELNTQTGQVLTRIGGKHPTFKQASAAVTAYQHDASMLPSGMISVFDNGATPKVQPESRALILDLNPRRKTETVVAAYTHKSPSLLADSQGNVQSLGDGNVFVGWGAEPYFSEFTPGGQMIYDAHMHGSYQSYRTYRFPWTATPEQAPAIAASAASSTAPVSVYASWNGATEVADWRVLAGTTQQQLAPVATAARSGFETEVTTPAHESYVAVQALNQAGAVIGTSNTIAG
ncbi:MAG: arylsulfotransferase family protein [Solirubrobacteraceae bacterium]